jgi:hypothetical protein
MNNDKTIIKINNTLQALYYETFMNLQGNEIVALLGCYTVLLVVSYRRFGRAYPSHHEG